jgi:small-conductance mechanosensitive channel
MLDFGEWRSWPVFENSLTSWLLAGVLMVAALFVLLGLRRAVRGYAGRLRATAHAEVLELPMEILSRTTLLFLVAISLFVGLRALTLGPALQRILDTATTIIVFFQVGVWAGAAVRAWVERRRHSTAQDRAVVGSLGIISFLASVVIWAFVLLLILDNLGVNITALVAGLGIGGVAVALALQNVLGDLFASLSIALDRPFVVGDFLAVDTFLGSVEYIGIKTTRLRSLDGEQIILSNSDLLKSRVRNYGRMSERRVQFATRIGYETPVEIVERLPSLIREIIEAEKPTRFDRSHFLRHGDSALEFETVYYVLTPDYNHYMDIQQSINLKLHRKFGELGLPFAYPTQKLVFNPATLGASGRESKEDGRSARHGSSPAPERRGEQHQDAEDLEAADQHRKRTDPRLHVR